ncbi:MAG: hypothetical protein HY876_10370 [Coriobacteriales bacterium]|nr:hypothetical protein [Coriobacteriales bacterium]
MTGIPMLAVRLALSALPPLIVATVSTVFAVRTRSIASVGMCVGSIGSLLLSAGGFAVNWVMMYRLGLDYGKFSQLFSWVFGGLSLVFGLLFAISLAVVLLGPARHGSEPSGPSDQRDPEAPAPT